MASLLSWVGNTALPAAGNFARGMVQGVVNPVSQFANDVGALGLEAGAVGQAATGHQPTLNDRAQQLVRPGGGLLHQGGVLQGRELTSNGGIYTGPNALQNIRATIGEGAQLGSLVAAPGAGFAAKGALAARLGEGAALGAGLNTIGAGGQQIATGHYDPKALAQSAALGALLGGAGTAAGMLRKPGAAASDATRTAKPLPERTAPSAPSAPGTFAQQMQAAQAKLDQLHAVEKVSNKLDQRLSRAAKLAKAGSEPTSNSADFVKLADQRLSLPQSELDKALGAGPKAVPDKNGLVHSAGRPADVFQTKLETAWKNNDLSRAQKIINMLPPELKASMQDLQDRRVTAASSGPAAPAAPKGAGVKQSQFTKTAMASPEVSPKVAKAIKQDPGNYVATSNAEHLANSEYYMTSKGLNKAKSDITTRLSVPTGKIDHQTVSDAIATAKALDARGRGADLQAATDIYNSLAEHLSRQGQSIQAASLLNNRTPEGLQFGALRALKKGGVDITPDLQKAVKGLADNVRKTAPGSDAHQLAVSRLVHFVNDKLPRSRRDAAVGIWRAGLLTGPETATKVAFSHIITLPFEATAQLPTAIADRAISLITGKRATSATLRGAGEGVVQGTKDFLYKMRSGIDAPNSGGEIPDFGARTHQTGYENFVGNLHGGLFKPAYEGRYQISLNDQAITEARNMGLKGAEREAFIRNFVNNPAARAKEIAAFDAARATNQQPTDLGNMAQSLSHLTMAGIPVGRILAPFTRIPSAIGTTGIVDYTPLGIGKEIASQVKAGKFDQRLMSQAIGRATTGTGVAALGGLLMANGRMTLKAPNDAKDRALWAAEGKQANSIYFGGSVTKNTDGTYNYQGGHWISLNPFGAIGITMGIGGAFQRARMEGQQDPTKAVSDAIQSGAGLLLDQPYFKGASGAANALSDPTRYAQTFLDSTVGSIIPTGISQLARGTDPNQRVYPANVPDTLQSEVPSLREGLPAKQDIYGNELPGSGGSVGGALNGVLNPFFPQAARNQGEPVTQELQRLYNALGSSTSPNIALPGKNLTINGQKVTMTPQQLHDYIAGSGPVLRQGIANLLQNPQYQQLGDEQKANEINKVITAAHAAQQITQFGQQPKSMSAATRLALASPGQLGTVISAPSVAITPQAKYQQDILKYQQQKAAGQLSPLQDFKAQQTLAREQITSAYANDATALYGMSKAQISSYLNANPATAQQTYAQLQQLDAQLYNAGMISTPKFRNGLATTTSSRLSAKHLTLPKVKGASSSIKLASYHVRAPRGTTAKAPKFRTTVKEKAPRLAVIKPKVSRSIA